MLKLKIFRKRREITPPGRGDGEAKSDTLDRRPRVLLHVARRNGLGEGRLEDDRDRESGRSRTLAKLILPATQLVIDALYESADACPPLKSAVGGIRAITNLCNNVKGNREEARRINELALEILDALSDTVTDATSIPAELLSDIVSLDAVLQDVAMKLEEYAKMNRLARIAKNKAHSSLFQAMRQRLVDTLQIFQTKAAIRLQTKLQMMGRRVEDIADVQIIGNDYTRMKIEMVLDRLDELKYHTALHNNSSSISIVNAVPKLVAFFF